MNLSQARANMIEQQVRPWDVLDQSVLDTLEETPREKFVAESLHGVAYADYEIPIGYGQYMLKPAVDGRILQSLALQPTHNVLEIGAGSGFLTACLARLAARVDSVEIVAPLAEQANQRLQTLGISNVTLRALDASQEWDADDAYDAIALTGSVSVVPDWYKHKLAIDGTLFAIVGESANPTMEAVRITRISGNEWIQESLFETRAPRLQGF